MKKGRARKKILKGRAYIKATFNNTIITLTDEEGNVLAWSSPGAIGYKGTKKSTAFVATKAAEHIVTKVQKIGLREVDVYVSGPGAGRVAAIKGLASAGLNILSLHDVTPIKHGGCKSRKVPKK